MPDPASSDHTAGRLTALEAGQTAMNQALGLMIDTLQQQANLLMEIAQAVRQEPGPSPIVQSLDELTTAVVRMGAGLKMVQAQMEALPAAIEAAFAAGDAQASEAG